MRSNDVVIERVEHLKSKGATALKFELEAQLNRRSSGGCDYCEDGRRECANCEGDWEGERCTNDCDEGQVQCGECEGEGHVECQRCDGDGHILLPSGNRSRLNCRDCLGEGTVDCPEHCYEGTVTCEECDGETGYYSDCDHCEEGYVDCGECDGSGASGSWGDVSYCHNWLMEALSHLGLAESSEHFYLTHDGYSEWRPVAPLRYAEFYNDGSVDSEFTLTLDLNDPKNVLLVPKIIEVWNDFCRSVGNGVDIHGAGMHTAILFNNEYEYPYGTSNQMEHRFNNFRRSLTMLLPALYFLGSSNENSRGLNFRRPEVGNDTHRAAIDYRNGALEFRIFDTCYQTPEAVLDNIVVISNCMKYWTDTYHNPRLDKIASDVRFGIDTSDKLERLYITETHIDLLNKGLRILKPSYYSVKELKIQRKFNRTKAHAKNRLKQAERDAITEYKEYENRFDWSVMIRRHRRLYEYMDNVPAQQRLPENRESVMSELEARAEQDAAEMAREKQSLPTYIAEKLRQIQEQEVGQYRLRV